MKELPKGFITKKNGDKSHQVIQVGDLLGLLQDTYGKELELNLMSGEPEINRQPIPNASVENFYVILSKLGYKINKIPARDGLMTSAQCNSYHLVVDEFHRIELDDSIYPIDLDQVATDY